MNPSALPLPFPELPDLPQARPTRRVAENLWRREEVRAIWLGGSMARGDADAYSDVDLRVAVEPARFDEWKRPDLRAIFDGACVAHHAQPFGDGAILHHLVLSGGEIFDLFVIRADRENPEYATLLLASRDDALAERVERSARPQNDEHAPAAADAIENVVMEFWINSHKHRKVLHRGLDLLALGGLHHEHGLLQRLWYASVTGFDPGQQRPSIHGQTRIVRTLQDALGPRALQVIGAPLGSRDLIVAHIEQLRREVSHVGHDLARTLGFEYPEALERTVTRCWEEFLAAPDRLV